MKYTLTVFLFFSILILKGQQMQYKLNAVDSLLNDLTRKDLFSGVVLIADSSEILLSKGYGYSDRKNKIKNTIETQFDLSSGSKIFTGTAITYLAQIGKLKFTDKVEKYIKGLPKGNIITLHQILTHSAGFDDFWKAKNFTYQNVNNCSDIIPFMRKLPLVYEPGDSCIYSTGDLIILGAVIEKITGLDYTQYIKNIFINPLQLSNTSFMSYRELDKAGKKFANGYRKDRINGYSIIPYNYDNGFIPLSAGGAWSNVIDLYKFDKAVFFGKILDEKYLNKMTTKYTPQWGNCHFGYVWIIDDSNTNCIGHAGNSSGWNTWNYYYPKQKMTIVILTNLGSVDIFDLASKVDNVLLAEK